jgi:hypothetical protein
MPSRKYQVVPKLSPRMLRAMFPKSFNYRLKRAMEDAVSRAMAPLEAAIKEYTQTLEDGGLKKRKGSK